MVIELYYTAHCKKKRKKESLLLLFKELFTFFFPRLYKCDGDRVIYIAPVSFFPTFSFHKTLISTE